MVITEEAHQALRDEAKKHSKFESFRDEMLRLTESVWHGARRDNETKPVEDEADPGDANQDIQSDESTVIQNGSVDPVPVQPDTELVQPLNPVTETVPAQPAS